MNKIKTKKYYRIKFQLTSPLSIGSGENNITDKDILKNSKEVPYIPGSSLAGVYRSIFIMDDIDKYFGKVDINTSTVGNNNTEAVESKIKVYDANICNGVPQITKRDCVALDEYRTAKKGSKFDFEVIDLGVNFITYLEQDFTDTYTKDVGKIILQKWAAKGLSFGSKTMRGFGETKLISVDVANFDFDNNENIDKWLDFDMYDPNESCWTRVFDIYNPNESCWTSDNLESEFKENNNEILLELSQKSGISIRKYSTAVNSEKNPQADFVQLTNIDGSPVIPGTSWAGVFRHSMEKINHHSCDELFGTMSSKSKISFSESVITGAKPKILTRNAINRFTGGAKNSALFTEQYYYGGNTTLRISFPKEINVESLVAAVFDLHFGFMAIGGLSGIGRGLFEITIAKINGTEVDIPNMEERGDTERVFKQWIDVID